MARIVAKILLRPCRTPGRYCGWSASRRTPTASGMSEEEIVCDVFGFALVAVAECVEEMFEVRNVPGGHFEACEHAPEVGPVIAVVEQADVPAAAKLLEECHQRAWTLGELEPAEPLVHDLGASAADHVTDMQFCRLVSRQIDRRVAAVVQRRGDLCRVLTRARRNADEDVRDVPAAQPVVEFRDDAAADRGAERAKCAG